MNSTSPVEYLIAFGAAFAAGALSLFAVQKWTQHIQNKAKES